MIDLLVDTPTPAALRALGEDGIRTVMATRSPRLAKTLTATILAAPDAQTVVVPGTTEFGRVIAGVATQLRQVRTERTALAADVEARLATHPLAEVLTSMPGLGVRTALKILTIIGDGAAFPTAGHLAAYAGLAPVTRRSGSSIRGETHSQRGNHALKSALFLSAFTSLADPTSRAYYDRKRAQGKRHNAALICLAGSASVLIGVLRGEDTIARLGGDEFAVLLPTVTSVAEATAVATKLQAALHAPFRVHDIDLDVEASIGIVVSGAHGQDPTTLLQHADIAMYVAKDHNLGVCAYDPACYQRMLHSLLLTGNTV